MSVINKQPFIDIVLGTLSSTEIAKLKSLINGGGDGPVFRSLVPGSSALLNKSEYASYPLEVTLELSGVAAQRLHTGYLVFDGTDANHTHCVLISYSGEQNQYLTLIDLHYADNFWKWEIKNCNLTITDLRSELDDVSEEVSGYTKVVALTSSSGTLTAEQFEDVKGDDCVINYGGITLKKIVQNNNVILYGNVTEMEIVNSHIKGFWRQFYVTINPSDKTYEYSYNDMEHIAANEYPGGTVTKLNDLTVGTTKYEIGSVFFGGFSENSPTLSIGDPDASIGTFTFEFLGSNFDFSQYSFYVVAFNGTFIMTPFTTTAALRALGATSVIYDASGNTALAKYRFASYEEDTTQLTLTIKLSGDAVFSITPTAYLFGVK